MAAPTTFAELYAAVRNEMASRQPELSLFEGGTVLDALTGGLARVGEVAVAEVWRRFLAHQLTHATGTDLDVLVQDILGELRLPAAAATLTVTLARPTTAAGDVAVDPAVNTFQTDPDEGEPVVFVPLAPQVMTGLTLDVLCRAATAGTAGNVRAATVVAARPALSDPTVTLTNAVRASDGADVETDAAFRQRMLNLVRSMARGTVLALFVGAMRVAGVAAAAVDESLARWDRGGLVRVRIGDVNGAASSALVAATTAELESWRAAGVAVSVLAGTVQWIPALGVVVRMRTAAFDAGYVTAQAKAAVTAACEDLAADEALYQERLDSAVWEVLGGAAELRDVASSSSTGVWPLVPDAGFAWRVDPAVVAVTVIGP